jgi:hypothetical protein
MQRFMLRIDTQKNTCYDDIGLYAQYVSNILCSIPKTIGRTYVITKQEKASTFWHPTTFASQIQLQNSNDDLHDCHC